MFSEGKIYKISSSGGKPYIGSTTLPLETRFRLHKQYGTKYSVKIHVQQPDIKIELLEKYPCENNTELTKRERFWTEQIECCNNRKPFRSKEEERKYAQKYYDNDYWRDYHKSYYKKRFLRELPFYLGV